MPTTTAACEPDPLDDDPDVIVIRSRAEKWRFKCPNPPHHDDWRLWDGVFACETCRSIRNAGEPDVQSVFAELLDTKTGELVPRDRVRVDR